MTHSTKPFRVVVAIDFGTARSGYAYAFTDDNHIVGRTVWPGQASDYPKTLTHLLYASDKKLVAWGYDARQQLAQHRKRNDAAHYSFFHRFKMELHESPYSSSNGPTVKSPSGHNFLVLDLISDYLAQIKEMALQDVRNATAGHLQDKQILWCLTIPAIWQDRAKNLMRVAARQAGLIGETESENERLLLVLEPEAAAVHCQEKAKSRFPRGTRFMVVDCGGWPAWLNLRGSPFL
jgi:molecular chaperone DnaK (HSP70)